MLQQILNSVAAVRPRRVGETLTRKDMELVLARPPNSQSVVGAHSLKEDMLQATQGCKSILHILLTLRARLS